VCSNSFEIWKSFLRSDNVLSGLLSNAKSVGS
jgi:hypothetical protein